MKKKNQLLKMGILSLSALTLSSFHFYKIQTNKSDVSPSRSIASDIEKEDIDSTKLLEQIKKQIVSLKELLLDKKDLSKEKIKKINKYTDKISTLYKNIRRYSKKENKKKTDQFLKLLKEVQKEISLANEAIESHVQNDNLSAITFLSNSPLDNSVEEKEVISESIKELENKIYELTHSGFNNSDNTPKINKIVTQDENQCEKEAPGTTLINTLKKQKEKVTEFTLHYKSSEKSNMESILAGRSQDQSKMMTAMMWEIIKMFKSNRDYSNRMISPSFTYNNDPYFQAFRNGMNHNKERYRFISEPTLVRGFGQLSLPEQKPLGHSGSVGGFGFDRTTEQPIRSSNFWSQRSQAPVEGFQLNSRAPAQISLAPVSNAHGFKF